MQKYGNNVILQKQRCVKCRRWYKINRRRTTGNLYPAYWSNRHPKAEILTSRKKTLPFTYIRILLQNALSTNRFVIKLHLFSIKAMLVFQKHRFWVAKPMLLASKRWCFTTRKHSFCKSVDYFSSFHLIYIDFSSLSFSKIIARFVLVWWSPFVKKVSILAGAVSCLLRGYRDKSIVKWIEMYIRKQAHKLCYYHFSYIDFMPFK